MIEQKTQDAVVHGAFLIGLISKTVNAIIEIASGLFLYFLNNDKLVQIAVALTHGELTEDPGDKISRFLIQAAQNLSVSGRIFDSMYLLLHGIIKILLVWALLRKKLFAYPLAILIFSIFIAYQLYRFAYNHSLWLVLLSVLDALIIILTWLEYKRIKQPLEKAAL